MALSTKKLSKISGFHSVPIFAVPPIHTELSDWLPKLIKHRLLRSWRLCFGKLISQVFVPSYRTSTASVAGISAGKPIKR